MLGFSKQEQRFIVLLLFALAVGLGIQSVKKYQPEKVNEVWAVEYDKILADFKQKTQARVAQEELSADSAKKGSYSEKAKFVGRININTAESEELQTLPGIGPATATKILDYRASEGAFTKIEDLQKVKGIGPKKFEKIKSFIVVH
jgi:competence protein ComEA